MVQALVANQKSLTVPFHLMALHVISIDLVDSKKSQFLLYSSVTYTLLNDCYSIGYRFILPPQSQFYFERAIQSQFDVDADSVHRQY